MSEDAHISVANSGVSDKGQPKAVLKVSERIAFHRHTGFSDLESEREEGIAHHIEPKYQLDRILNENTPKGKELIDRIHRINPLYAPRPRPYKPSINQHLHKHMKHILHQGQENQHIVYFQRYTVVIIIVVIVRNFERSLV